PGHQRPPPPRLNTEPVQPPDLVGVVGHEADRPGSRVLEDLGADAVLPEIGGETQGVVGLHRIQPLILEGVGPDLVEKAGASAFKKIRAYALQDQRSEEHTSELQSRENLVCRLLLEKKKKTQEISDSRLQT